MFDIKIIVYAILTLDFFWVSLHVLFLDFFGFFFRILG